MGSVGDSSTFGEERRPMNKLGLMNMGSALPSFLHQVCLFQPVGRSTSCFIEGSFGESVQDFTLGPPVVPLSPLFGLGGFPYYNRLQKKIGYPYSVLSTGGPSKGLSCAQSTQVAGAHGSEHKLAIAQQQGGGFWGVDFCMANGTFICLRLFFLFSPGGFKGNVSQLNFFFLKQTYIYIFFFPGVSTKWTCAFVLDMSVA